MKKHIILIILCLIIFVACTSGKDAQKALTDKKWYVYAIGVSSYDSNRTEGEFNYVYHNKDKGAKQHWTFTSAGNYTMVENETIAGGKWNLNNNKLKLTQILNNSVKFFDILELNTNELQLKNKNLGKGQIASYILIFKNELENWPSDEEIKRLNAENKLLQ